VISFSGLSSHWVAFYRQWFQYLPFVLVIYVPLPSQLNKPRCPPTDFSTPLDFLFLYFKPQTFCSSLSGFFSLDGIGLPLFPMVGLMEMSMFFWGSSDPKNLSFSDRCTFPDVSATPSPSGVLRFSTFPFFLRLKLRGSSFFWRNTAFSLPNRLPLLTW